MHLEDISLVDATIRRRQMKVYFSNMKSIPKELVSWVSCMLYYALNTRSYKLSLTLDKIIGCGKILYIFGAQGIMPLFTRR